MVLNRQSSGERDVFINNDVDDLPSGMEVTETETEIKWEMETETTATTETETPALNKTIPNCQRE